MDRDEQYEAQRLARAQKVNAERRGTIPHADDPLMLRDTERADAEALVGQIKCPWGVGLEQREVRESRNVVGGCRGRGCMAWVSCGDDRPRIARHGEPGARTSPHAFPEAEWESEAATAARAAIPIEVRNDVAQNWKFVPAQMKTVVAENTDLSPRSIERQELVHGAYWIETGEATKLRPRGYCTRRSRG